MQCTILLTVLIEHSTNHTLPHNVLLAALAFPLHVAYNNWRLKLMVPTEEEVRSKEARSELALRV